MDWPSPDSPAMQKVEGSSQFIRLAKPAGKGGFLIALSRRECGVWSR
jgi:hypothetical protein